MFIANGNIEEFNNLKKLSVEDYLLRFKKFVDDFNLKQKENGR